MNNYRTFLSRTKPALFFTLCILAFSPYSAAQPPLNELLRPLASDPTWLALLHFRPGTISNSLKSEVDDPEFFLAKNGSNDAEQELHATVRAFLNATKLATTNKDPAKKTSRAIKAQDAACRFPARYHWIQKQLAGKLTLPNFICDEFDQWLAEFNAQSLTLIYPASYLNSPSSMYGHTLIRVNQVADKHSNNLLAYSINYAATADPTDNELVFSWKGLTGGYPGQFSVLRYYTKVNEYNAIENRDLWEYDLNLSYKEVIQFLRHSWEIKEVRFDYYFFDENCAYRILTMLDAATPRYKMENNFRLAAAPVDTIRSLTQQNMVTSTNYLPSMAKILKHQIKQSSELLKQLAIEIVDKPSVLTSPRYKQLSAIQQAQVLELAYGFIRFTDKREKIPLKDRTKKSLSILSKRAKLGITSPFESMQAPTLRDDQGHRSSRFTAGVGQRHNKSYVVLSSRASYHDLLDPNAGYPPGSEIETANLELRIDEKGHIKINHFALVNITSLTPRTDFFSPVSWRVTGGIKRYQTDYIDQAVAFIEGGSGVSYPVAKGLIFALAEAEFNAQRKLEKGYAIGGGVQFGYLFQGQSIQTRVSFKHRNYILGARHTINQLSTAVSYNTGRNSQLRFTFGRTNVDHKSGTDINFEYAHYY
ncbi:MAG: DUF4105 domain-containing protein [Pseudomonadales bacterium]|nr:DUF4105 domain-containing protein [Pseudomonadales bacterium]